MLPPTSRLTDIPLAGREEDNLLTKDSDIRNDLQNWWDLLILIPGDNPTHGDHQGVCIREALPPVPEKLVIRINHYEFIHMAERKQSLVQEHVTQTGVSALVYHKCPVTNVLTWVQCFRVYVGILAKQFPETVPELMSYMITIIQASRNYEGLSWVNYKTLYRR